MSRYLKHTLLDEIGEKGQSKLAHAKVAIIGCGGLGSIVGPYLAGAGVGSLLLIDADTVHISNLHRQVFYTENDIQKSKSEVLAARLQALNKDINISAQNIMLSKDNIDLLLSDSTLVIECTDHIQTKYLVNDYCHLKAIPLIYGALHKYEGYVSVFANVDLESIHLRDIFPYPDAEVPTCSQVGVVNTIAGIIGMLQANEAIKFITGAGETLQGKLLTYNALDNRQWILQLKKSFGENILELYSRLDYAFEKSCASYEITWESIQEDESAYQLVSILPEEEHIALGKEVIHYPDLASDIEAIFQLNRIPVLYCLSGKRSADLVQKILTNYPKSGVLSLKGGASIKV